VGDSAQLDREIDRLYGLPLGEFVAERDALSRALAAQGRKQEAGEVKALRKPTKPAWVVNQLARENRREVDLLLDASFRLRQAQEGGSESGEFGVAVRSQRQAVAALVAAAETVLGNLGEAAPANLLRDVENTLRASAAAEEGRELLARGRLTQALAPTGFELLGAVAPPKRGQRPPPPQEPPRPDERRERIERAQQELRSARARARDAAKVVRDAETAESKARRALAAAEQDLTKARARLAEAEAAVEQAEAALADARAR
jgi:hypothetical protein